MVLSETLAALIINNSFILVGAALRYLAGSECMKLACCGKALEIENLHHINSEAKQEADDAIDTMTSTVAHPLGLEKK